MANAPFDRLPPALATGLQESGFIRILTPAEQLYSEGAYSNSVYVVLDGLVQLAKYSPSGGHTLVAIRGAGDLVGQHSALDGGPRLVDASALTPTRLVCMLRSRFESLVRDDPDVALLLLGELSGYVRELVDHVGELLDEKVAVLMARRLVQLAVDPKLEPLRTMEGHTIVIQSLMSQANLAGWAGVSQRAAGAALHDFRDEGLISTSRLRIEILDLTGLRRRAKVV